MSFFSVLAALILEQFHALSQNNFIHTMFRRAVDAAAKNLNSGNPKDGQFAWYLLVLPPAFIVAFVHYMLLDMHPVWAFIWNVSIVYLTLGFRQFSHYFTDIHKALLIQDIYQARQILHTWTKIDTSEMDMQEIARLTLKHAIIAAHRHVFGVFFCFLLPIGPAGVVIYRMAEYIARQWSISVSTELASFGTFAQKTFQMIDWLPVRLTALGFAIVGNFEDAIHAWRRHAKDQTDTADNILLASAGGALGVRLENSFAPAGHNAVLLDHGEQSYEAMQLATVHTLQSAVGLVWRAVVLWMLLLVMLSVAKWLG